MPESSPPSPLLMFWLNRPNRGSCLQNVTIHERPFAEIQGAHRTFSEIKNKI